MWIAGFLALALLVGVTVGHPAGPPPAGQYDVFTGDDQAIDQAVSDPDEQQVP